MTYFEGLKSGSLLMLLYSLSSLFQVASLWKTESVPVFEDMTSPVLAYVSTYDSHESYAPSVRDNEPILTIWSIRLSIFLYSGLSPSFPRVTLQSRGTPSAMIMWTLHMRMR